MNILIISNIETVGEWLATQNMVEQMKKKSAGKFYLLAYGNNQLHLQKNLFEKVMLVKPSPLLRPFRYYRQISLEFINSLSALHRFKRGGSKIHLIIATEYRMCMAMFVIYPWVRKLFWFHGVRHDYKILNKNFNFYLFLRTFLERLSWFLSDMLIVPSEEAKKFINSNLWIFHIFKKIQIIPNVVSDFFLLRVSKQKLSLLKKRYSINSKHRVILYAGRVEEKKGLIELIAAFYKLKKEIRNLTLIIAYPSIQINTRLFENINRYIAQKKLKSEIKFLCDLNQQELSQLYQIADIGVLASSLEMDSMFLLEAVTSGLPILTTPVGRAGSVVKPTNPQFILNEPLENTIYFGLKDFINQHKKWNQSIVANVTKQRDASIREFLKLESS